MMKKCLSILLFLKKHPQFSAEIRQNSNIERIPNKMSTLRCFSLEIRTQTSPGWFFPKSWGNKLVKQKNTKTPAVSNSWKAAMQPGSHWRSAAPWIRRGPTLPERRRAEERKPQAFLGRVRNGRLERWVVGTLSGQFFGVFFLFVLVFVVNV